MAAFAALFIASPFLLYQVWAFIAPGLYSRERQLALPFIFFTTLFFLAGGAFGYYVAFPMGAGFLLDIGRDLQAVITADKYFGFLLTVILGLGLMFELPILILLLSLLGVITPRMPAALLAPRGGDHLHRRGHHHADPGRGEPLHLRRPRDLPLLPGSHRRLRGRPVPPAARGRAGGGGRGGVGEGQTAKDVKDGKDVKDTGCPCRPLCPLRPLLFDRHSSTCPRYIPAPAASELPLP